MDNVIIANFNGHLHAVTDPLWRYDEGMRLQFEGVDLPAAYQVHFANEKDGDAIPVYGDETGAEIPYELLEDGYNVYAWVYVTGDGYGRTKYVAQIPVMIKARPSEEEPSPVQQSALDEAINAVNEAAENLESATANIPSEINAALEAAKESGEFDGADGSGVWYTTARVFAGSGNPFVRRRDLIGREGATVQVNDLLFAPDVGYEGEPTTLYEITSVGIACALKRLCKMKGTDGEDGTSPTVTITEITGGHRITITSAAHPDGQSFDVMDGTGGGVTVDDALSGSSTNPVQNKVVKAALDGKGTYTKPASGIPKTDLAEDVQASLGKADTALQPGDVDEPFVVTYTAASGATATCDKTYAQIMVALQAKQEVLAFYVASNSVAAQLTTVAIDASTSDILFTNAQNGGVTTLRHKSDGTITVSANDGYVYQNQGSANAGKVLKVGNDGTVAPVASVEPLVVTYTAANLTSGGTTCNATYAQMMAAIAAGQPGVAVLYFQNKLLGAFATCVGNSSTGELNWSGITDSQLGLVVWRITHSPLDVCSTGVVPLSSDSGGAVDSVNGYTGTVILTASDVGAVDSSQGSANAGKFLVVGNDGLVTTMTLSTWSAGSY